MDAVLNCLVDDSMLAGDYSESLSRYLATELSVSGGIGLRDFGTALDLTFNALNLDEGARVLISALAPATFLKALLRLRLEPDIRDVDPATGTLSRESIESAADSDVQAIILDSPFGIAHDFPELADFQVPVIEDITYSLCNEPGDGAGRTIGRYVLLRLEEDGVITAGGGTLVFGRHKRAYGELRAALDDSARYSILGNINSALATVQFRHLHEFVERRRNIAEVFVKALARGKHTAPTANAFDSSSHALFPVVLDGSLKDAVRYAKSKGVATQPAFSESIFTNTELERSIYPNAGALCMRCLLFPLYPLLKRNEVENVAKVLATLP